MYDGVTLKNTMKWNDNRSRRSKPLLSLAQCVTNKKPEKVLFMLVHAFTYKRLDEDDSDQQILFSQTWLKGTIPNNLRKLSSTAKTQKKNKKICD